MLHLVQSWPSSEIHRGERPLHYRIVAWATVVLFLLAPVAVADGYALHTVRPGDSLGSIASSYNITVDALMAANDLKGSVIHPGDTLTIPYVEAIGGPAVSASPRIPPGFSGHTLQPGQTLSSVATAYGLSVEALVGANPTISSLDNLPAGVDLLIPPRQGLVVTLEAGQSLADVLSQYHVDPATVARANHLRSPFDVEPGMMLFLPGVVPTKALARLKKVREAEHRFIWPIQGRITSPYGPRNLGMGTAPFHRGIDIAAPWGTPVHASRSGVVIFAGWSNEGYGNLVRIRHPDGDETWYGHFSKILVHVGQYVDQGQVIGREGSTGISTGPHVHFEVLVHGRAVDPMTERH
ncbi:MAG: M23 family metallopeptidase [Deinococcales bacterium]